jgi:hypothetical protein
MLAGIDAKYKKYLHFNFVLFSVTFVVISLLDAEKNDQFLLMLGLLVLSLAYFVSIGLLIRHRWRQPNPDRLLVVKWLLPALLATEIGVYFGCLILRTWSL